MDRSSTEDRGIHLASRSLKQTEAAEEANALKIAVIFAGFFSYSSISVHILFLF